MDGLPSVVSPVPPTFEELGLHHGLALYRFSLSAALDAYPLKIEAERATLVGEGEHLGVLVESVGRANYGPRLGEPEGIAGPVMHGHQIVHGFTTTAFAVDDISGLPWGATSSAADGPVFSRGWLDLEEVGDAAIATPGVKGYLWVNGFLLGRYWNVGPQTELYLPWPLLRLGRNEIVVLELLGEPVTTVSLH
jgi:beta-galactosidase